MGERRPEYMSEDWRHDAACKTEDPELFFPIGESGPALLQAEEAKAICNSPCDARDACLAWALESGQDAGVWGGMSEQERRALKRRGGMQVLRAEGALALRRYIDNGSKKVFPPEDTSAKKAIPPPTTKKRHGLQPTFATPEERAIYEHNNRSRRSA